MSIFSDRRSLRQIGGLRAYLRQVSWSLRWQIGWRRRVRRTLAGPDTRLTGPDVFPGRQHTNRARRPAVPPVEEAAAHPGRAAGPH